VDIAEGANIPLLVGAMFDTGVGTAAGAHLAASIKMLEFHCDTRFHLKLVEDILEEPLIVKDGFIFPKGPGLGIKLDEIKLRKYRID